MLGLKEMPIPAQQHKNYFQHLIASIDPVVVNDEVEPSTGDNQNMECDVLDTIDTNVIENWLERIKWRSILQCNVNTEQDNFHYCPELSEDLLKFLKSISLWSAILQPVKSKELPMRMDKFFIKYYTFIEGMMVVAGNENKLSQEVKQVSKMFHYKHT